MICVFCLLLLRKFLKSLITKQPRDLLLVIGTGVSAAVAPGIPALCSWRSCIEAVIEVAEQLEVLHPGDVAEFCKEVIKDRDLLVVAHDLIRKMSPVSVFITYADFWNYYTFLLCHQLKFLPVCQNSNFTV